MKTTWSSDPQSAWAGVRMWSAALAVGFVADLTLAAPTVINFDNLTAPATITTQYGTSGAVFLGAYLDTDPAAQSAPNVLRSVPPGSEIFTPQPFIVNFTSAQARVKFFGGSQFASLNGTVTAFDAANNVVATDGPRLVPQNTFTTVFEVTTTTAVITRIEFQLEGSAFESMDDLEFEGNPPAPPPAQPPVVTITSPTNGAELDVTDIDIAGTVTGEGLLPTAKLTMEWKRPPESTAPPFTSDLSLTGTGTSRNFALHFTNAPLGPITITVTAENFAAMSGSNSVTVNNLPGAIRDRFSAQGGAGVLGAFQYGLTGGGCRLAVYEHGAISDAKLFIGGDIFTKWLSIKGPNNNQSGFFGCPTNDQTATASGIPVQSFTGGRIYAGLPGGGSAYVPAVFVNALDKRGGEASNGLPLADPTSSIGAMRTWLFQQFARPGQTELPSTLEIRGTPPTLNMERQGGAWFLPQLAPSDRDVALSRSAATLWEIFPCTDNLGPCDVSDEAPFPPENISNAGALFCDGTTYWPGHIGGPPEWAPVQSVNGDYVATPVYGAIISSFFADIDNIFTHEHTFGNCPYCPDTIFGATTPIGGACPTCPSDYEWKVRPIGPQPGAFPRPSLFGQNNKDRIKMEYELYYASAAHAFLGTPQTGDLVHATGRWIIDCGHDSYNSELHPIFSYATMKTVVSETNPNTGLEEVLFGGKQATRVAIWVNGWYPGGDSNAIEFDAFPPPRPSPNSVLHVVKPVDLVAGDNSYRAAEDVSLEFQLAPAGAASHVHLKFTSPRRENHVTDAGEMMFEAHRQYWGKWYLYWGD